MDLNDFLRREGEHLYDHANDLYVALSSDKSITSISDSTLAAHRLRGYVAMWAADLPPELHDGWRGGGAFEELSMTFKAWLMLQMKRVDPVGDLAREVLKDRTWPLTQDTVKLRHHMVKRGAVENTLLVLDRAYSEYQKQNARQRTSDRPGVHW
jgi:uncharacterized protein YozE (UPF0346 family)